MMLNQFGQKKKREAVRRLSQNAARRLSSEGRLSKRTIMFGQQSSPESMSKKPNMSDSSVSPRGFFKQDVSKVSGVEHGRISEQFPSQFEMASGITPVFGGISASKDNSSAPAVGKQTTSTFVFGEQSSGFPVSTSEPRGFGVPGSSTSSPFSTKSPFGFPVASTTTATTSPVGFPVFAKSTVTTSTIGFPVSFTSTQTAPSVGFPVSSTSPFGFPVSSASKVGFPVSSTSTTSTSSVSTVPSVGFPVPPPKFVGLSSFTSTDKKNVVGFPVSPVTANKELEENKSTGFPVSKEFGIKSASKGFGIGDGQKRQPLKQTQSLQSFGNMKSFEVPQTHSAKPTSPDISKLKSLIIREIPPDCNKNAWLRRFYSRFGEVVKVLCNPTKASATVTFVTHEAAKLAKVKGRVLQKGMQPVSIFWKQERKRTTSGSQDSKVLVPKTEKVKQITTEKTTGKEAVSASDLQSLPLATSSGDKYKILEKIDSKLREGLTKTSDINAAKAAKGTCPDMCPEKERYMREDRRRLHVFETIPGTGSMEENPLINHAKAVKEYDRSAADKEEPLPHELRPIATLQMTMDYLVTNIMDDGEGRWADWFDFLWNRTRAIRKDITQQHLCDPGAVDLIEKTARFHIFCSHYLCDQDFGVFDPKINTENLTKCLQTLKHFYDDLDKNQNIICPFEAEFRCYDILLNLNEGDILRQVMTYREEVRLSPLVKFAMEVFHALNSNNSVRFFRLVRSSNYLCSCLLHRYFTQVRQQAIRILNYSLSVANKEMLYPLSELTQMLAFEDDKETAEFCRFHGMTVKESHVVFMRGSFIEPETAFPSSRSLRLIESKRSSLIGEIVYNGPLPSKPDHQPSSSFDSNGNYIGNCHILPTSPDSRVLPPGQGLAQEAHKSFGVASHLQDTQFQMDKNTEPVKHSSQIDIEEVKEVTRSIYHEVMNEMLVDITKDMYGKVQQLLELSNNMATKIEEEIILSLLKDIAENAILEEQRQQFMEAQQALQREKVCKSLADDVLNEVLEEETYKTATLVYNKEYQRLIQECRDVAAQQICQQILEQTVREEVNTTIQNSLRELKTQRKLTLQQIAHRFMMKKRERYFRKWVKAYHSLVRLKNLLSNFPVHSPFTSCEEQLNRLIGQQYKTGPSTLHETRIFGEEQNIAETLAHRQAELEQIRSEVLRPIDIPQLIAESSNSAQFYTDIASKSHMDWKLLVSFPDSCQDLGHSAFIDSLKVHVNTSIVIEKFKKGTVVEEIDFSNNLSRKIELLSLYRTELPSSMLSVRRYCHICTLGSYGVLTNNEATELKSSRQLQGTSAIMILTDSSEFQSHSERQELRARVQRLLQCKPSIPTIPVAILFIDNQSSHVTQEAILETIGIDNLSHQVSEILIARLSSVVDVQTLNDVLNRTTSSLWQRSSNQLKLHSNSLKSFVEEGIQQYFFTSFYDDIATRKNVGLSDQCPEAVISLYNAVIEHLASVASSSKLNEVSWPIKEFFKSKDLPDVDWNSEASLSSLNSLILSLCLPTPPPRAEDGLWDSEAMLCQQYSKQNYQTSVYLTQRIDRILLHKRRSLQFSRISADDVPWTQVIEACISSVLTSLHSDPLLSQTEVYFFEDEFEGFEQPKIWREVALLSKRERTIELENKRVQKSVCAKSKDSLIHESVERINKDLDMIISNTNKRSVHKKKQTSLLEDSVVDLKGRLNTALLEARSDIMSFEEDLQQWLPECYTGKRKADCIPDSQKPILKVSRHAAGISPSSSF